MVVHLAQPLCHKRHALARAHLSSIMARVPIQEGDVTATLRVLLEDMGLKVPLTWI